MQVRVSTVASPILGPIGSRRSLRSTMQAEDCGEAGVVPKPSFQNPRGSPPHHKTTRSSHKETREDYPRCTQLHKTSVRCQKLHDPWHPYCGDRFEKKPHAEGPYGQKTFRTIFLTNSPFSDGVRAIGVSRFAMMNSALHRPIFFATAWPTAVASG